LRLLCIPYLYPMASSAFSFLSPSSPYLHVCLLGLAPYVVYLVFLIFVSNLSPLSLSSPCFPSSSLPSSCLFPLYFLSLVFLAFLLQHS
jgi:hypothetical protein